MIEKEFISGWIKKISGEGIKPFPREFINIAGCQKIKLPGKALVIGEEFFGSFEIITVDGSPVLHADDYMKAKYIIYANRLKPEEILLPEDNDSVRKAAALYENYLDEIIKLVETDYKKNFPGEKNSASAVNEIFRMLNLVRY